MLVRKDVAVIKKSLVFILLFSILLVSANTFAVSEGSTDVTGSLIYQSDIANVIGVGDLNVSEKNDKLNKLNIKFEYTNIKDNSVNISGYIYDKQS
jgi:hypothetical protein